MAEEKQPKKPMSTKAQRERMIELGLLGASQKMIWSDLGITKSKAETLKKNDPDFADALDLALVHSQAHWERMMLANAENKNFNTRMVEVAVRGQFQQDYRETRDTKVDAKVDVVIDFKGEVANLINELNKIK